MTNVGADVEKRQPLSTVVGGNVFGEATMENSKKVLQKFKNRATIWSSNPSGYLSKVKKNIIWENIHTLMFVTAVFITAKTWKQRKDPDAGKDWRQEEKGMREDEMVG